MDEFVLYNNDVEVGFFALRGGVVADFRPTRDALLPMQLRGASPDGFALWLDARAIDLNTFQHRRLAQALIGSRDKIAIAAATHMFSVSDTFTCFARGEFLPRASLCRTRDQDVISDFILVSGDTSLRNLNVVTPNASTDGSFVKTWRWEAGEWWLYKLQSEAASRSEVEIGRALRACGLDAAEYRFADAGETRVKSRNFVGADEFFEPYESYRYRFADRRDDEGTVYANIASLGAPFERAWRNILLADALFLNTDRHMRNFGVIRSASTGETLRLAPNFDNNQAYLANPGGRYSDAMLDDFRASFGLRGDDRAILARLSRACEQIPYLAPAADVGRRAY